MANIAALQPRARRGGNSGMYSNCLTSLVTGEPLSVGLQRRQLLGGLNSPKADQRNAEDARPAASLGGIPIPLDSAGAEKFPSSFMPGAARDNADGRGDYGAAAVHVRKKAPWVDETGSHEHAKPWHGADQPRRSSRIVAIRTASDRLPSQRDKLSASMVASVVVM